MTTALPPPDAEAVLALLDRYLERHAATDLEGVLELFGEGALVEDPVGSPVHRGAEAIRDFYRSTQARNGRLAIERVGPAIVCGDEVALHVRAGLVAQASQPPMDVIYTLRIDRDGRIASLRAYF